MDKCNNCGHQEDYFDRIKEKSLEEICMVNPEQYERCIAKKDIVEAITNLNERVTNLEKGRKRK